MIQAPGSVDPVSALCTRSFEIEQRILGSLMLHPPAWEIIEGRICEDDFGEELHRIIFSAISQFQTSGRPANIFSMKVALSDVQLPGEVTIQSYLAHLASEAALPSAIVYDAKLLSEFGKRRNMVNVARELIEVSANYQIDRSASDIANDSLGALQSIVAGGIDDSSASIGQGATALMDYVRGVRAGKAAIRMVPTGFSDLDSATGGYEAGTLWIIGARPGVGKTVLAVTSSLKVARRGAAALRDTGEGFGAMLFSLEVPAHQINARYLADFASSRRTKLQFGRISRGIIDDHEMFTLEEAERSIQSLPLEINSSSRLTLQEIKSKVRAKRAEMVQRRTRLGAVFIDYLKFVKASDRYKGQRVYEVGEISAGLKELAKEENLCVILLAQLNRALEARDDKRPCLSDLRESGDLEADADVVAFIHREAAHIERSAEYRSRQPEALAAFAAVEFDAEIIIGKNRAGPTPIVNVWCDVSSSSMTSKAIEERTWR